ncbi:TlpA disulfide reductase family protein [Jannaschia rubra]|uniref:TlpA disulfide reductase family protein n=1 Tax=Jannaschia rubra TaxID=282197 RepID=UPI0024938EC8|nr:TlpA disulfide reductase family protein [Jannaschia rubra]
MLEKLRLALYGLALTLATPALALDPALLIGEMETLEPVESYTPAITGYLREDGSTGDLSDYAGKVVVLNFWATWCGPCKAEMPSLQALQDELGPEGLDVVTVAFGRHNPAAMRDFWDDAGITSLPLHLDPQTELARGLEVRGLPHSFVIGRDGRILAQLIGDADWSAPETLAVIRAYLEDEAPE